MNFYLSFHENGWLYKDVAKPNRVSVNKSADGTLVAGEMMKDIATIIPVSMCTGRCHHTTSPSRASRMRFELRK